MHNKRKKYPRIKTKLLSHQRRALKKIGHRAMAALFMDMGTGKTLTGLTYAARKIRQGKAKRCLWFCPVSTLDHVRSEITRHTTFEIGADIHLVGLQTLSSSARAYAEALAQADGAVVIVDESHMIKNHACNRARRLIEICARARARMIMTGTPICQGIEDLYGQFQVLGASILGYASFEAFAAHHLEFNPEYPTRVCNRRNHTYILSRIEPYTFQIKKSECLDLPDKIFRKVRFEMTEEQKDLYQQAKDEILRHTHSFTFGDTTIYRLFTALQQVASGYYNSRRLGFLSIFRRPGENPRIQALLKTIDAIPAGEKVVIWAKFIKEIDDILAVLALRYGASAAVRYDGSIPPRFRHNQVMRFRDQARFFVGTLGTGGMGIDLTAAAHVIYYSNSFRMTLKLQSMDRSHRLGQTRPVTYIDLESDARIDVIIGRCLDRRKDFIQEFKDTLARIRATRGVAAAERHARRTLETM